uniref:Uncharacterized protein n=1 Tax=Leersia perrieri TaxID=77586 RepID=A0A0D9WRH1_9ORYZ
MTTTQMRKEQAAPAPVRVRYCGVMDDLEQMEDEPPPSPLSPSRAPLPSSPSPDHKTTNEKYRFRRPGGA